MLFRSLPIGWQLEHATFWLPDSRVLVNRFRPRLYCASDCVGRAGALTWFAASKLRKVVSTEAGVLGGVWLVSDEPPPPQATTIETVAPSTASVDKRVFTGKPFRQKSEGAGAVRPVVVRCIKNYISTPQANTWTSGRRIASPMPNARDDARGRGLWTP